MNQDNRVVIEKGLDASKPLSTIAAELGKDPTTIAKEIKKHRVFQEHNTYNNPTHRCALAKDCHRKNVCSNELFCKRECKHCKYSPEYPIVNKENLHADVVNAIKALVNLNNCNTMLVQAYMQIILAHVFSKMKMVDKNTIGGDDLIYKVVEYVAKNFNEEINLDKMAYDLCVSKYVLSRVFAKTFHCNYNKYVNDVRLNYVATLLESTNESITNIGLDAGFESQRTFNRVFKERYKITPREYRNQIHSINTRSAQVV